MEIETKPTECEVCDNETRLYVPVKFGFGKGDHSVKNLFEVTIEFVSINNLCKVNNSHYNMNWSEKKDNSICYPLDLRLLLF
jgi:hypothetical protein